MITIFILDVTVFRKIIIIPRLGVEILNASFLLTGSYYPMDGSGFTLVAPFCACVVHIHTCVLLFIIIIQESLSVIYKMLISHPLHALQVTLLCEYTGTHVHVRIRIHGRGGGRRGHVTIKLITRSLRA